MGKDAGSRLTFSSVNVTEVCCRAPHGIRVGTERLLPLIFLQHLNHIFFSPHERSVNFFCEQRKKYFRNIIRGKGWWGHRDLNPETAGLSRLLCHFAMAPEVEEGGGVEPRIRFWPDTLGFQDRLPTIERLLPNMAEAAGFEPAYPLSAAGSLANCWVKPLPHASELGVQDGTRTHRTQILSLRCLPSCITCTLLILVPGAGVEPAKSLASEASAFANLTTPAILVPLSGFEPP